MFLPGKDLDTQFQGWAPIDFISDSEDQVWT